MKEWHERIKALKPIMAKQSGKLIDRINAAKNKVPGSWNQEMELTFQSTPITSANMANWMADGFHKITNGGLGSATNDMMKQQVISGNAFLQPDIKYEVEVTTQSSSAGTLVSSGITGGTTIWGRPVSNQVKWDKLTPGAITPETINVAAKPPNEIVTYEIDGEVIDFEVIFDDVPVKEVPKPTSDTDFTYKKYVDDLGVQKKTQEDYALAYNAYRSVWTNTSSSAASTPLRLINQVAAYT